MVDTARMAAIWQALSSTPPPELKTIFTADPDRLTKHVL